ncbi:MAG: hypothetical protein AAF922_12760 [Pseudomonadota bacterium]
MDHNPKVDISDRLQLSLEALIIRGAPCKGEMMSRYKSERKKCSTSASYAQVELTLLQTEFLLSSLGLTVQTSMNGSFKPGVFSVLVFVFSILVLILRK